MQGNHFFFVSLSLASLALAGSISDIGLLPCWHRLPCPSVPLRTSPPNPPFLAITLLKQLSSCRTQWVALAGTGFPYSVGGLSWNQRVPQSGFHCSGPSLPTRPPTAVMARPGSEQCQGPVLAITSAELTPGLTTSPAGGSPHPLTHLQQSQLGLGDGAAMTLAEGFQDG